VVRAALVRVGAVLGLGVVPAVVLAAVQDLPVVPAPAAVRVPVAGAVAVAVLVKVLALVRALAALVRAAALAPAAVLARAAADQAVGAEAEEALARYTVELTAASATVGSIRVRIPNPQPHLRVLRTVIERLGLTKPVA
jgi:hypothetical protein